MEKIWLGLGSNLGDSQSILQEAWAAIGRYEGINLLKLSSPYGSEPVGMASSNSFLNAAGVVECALTPVELLETLQEVERRFGRDKKTGSAGYQDRLLDLDILYFGSMIMDTGVLHIPHPHMADRLFVLVPLAEITPELLDPVNGLSILEMRNVLLRKIENGSMPPQKIKRLTWKH